MTTEQQTSETPAPRKTYEEEFFTLFNEFCDKVIHDVPELHGIAVIPLWNNQPEKTPSGLLRLQNPNPPHMASLMLLLQRLAIFGADVHKDLLTQLHMFSKYGNELVDEIKKYEEKLAQLETKQNE